MIRNKKDRITGNKKEVEIKVTKEEVGRMWRRNKFFPKKKHYKTNYL